MLSGQFSSNQARVAVLNASDIILPHCKFLALALYNLTKAMAEIVLSEPGILTVLHPLRQRRCGANQRLKQNFSSGAPVNGCDCSTSKRPLEPRPPLKIVGVSDGLARSLRFQL